MLRKLAVLVSLLAVVGCASLGLRQADAVPSTATSLGPTWQSESLDGEVYASPLVANGRVYVATQGNSVYALNESDGRTLWQTTIGQPVPKSALPCGDVSTTGI